MSRIEFTESSGGSEYETDEKSWRFILKGQVTTIYSDYYL